MTSHCSNSNSMSFSTADAFVKPGDMFISPSGVVSMSYNHICSFDECPLQVVVGLFAHLSIAELASAALDLGSSAGIAGEVLARRETIDAAHFAFDHNGEDHTHARECLQQLYGISELDPLKDPLFQALDMIFDVIKQLKLLFHTASSFWRKGLEGM